MSRSPLMPIAYALGIALCVFACQDAPPVAPKADAPTTAASAAPKTAAPKTAAPTTASVRSDAPATRGAAKPGVKPNYVKCDPARPELPCTPDVAFKPISPVSPVDKVSALATGRSEKAVRGCATDADCVVSCKVDGQCCGNLCQCQQTYNQTFFAELSAHQKVCSARCPKARCAYTDHRLEPACKAGLCVTKAVPR